MNQIKFPLFLCLVFIGHWLFAQKSFQKDEVESDLEFLKAQLTEYHPGLTTYSTLEEINEWFHVQISTLPDSVDAIQAYAVVSSFSSVLKDGHSYVYPSAEHLEAFFSGALLFPLDVFMTNDSLVVIGNYSQEAEIPLGSTLTHINGVEVAEMEAYMVKRTSRDGDNLGYPKHLFSEFFPAYHSYFYGFHNEFTIGFIDDIGVRRTATVKGMTRAGIKAKRPDEDKSGISVRFIPEHEAAVLSIASFDKKILKEDYGQNFRKEISAAFRSIKDKDVENLAIDLRDNQGGNLSNGIFLLQQFMDTSFQCVSSFNKLKNGDKVVSKTKWDNHFDPSEKNQFDGDIYLFINGGSFSCSAIVANTFKEYQRGILVGEMSGGSAYVNSGGPDHTVVLPNTRVVFTIPQTQYCLRESLNEIGLGVVPDIPLTDSAKRKYKDSDNYIKCFIKLIEE